MRTSGFSVIANCGGGGGGSPPAGQTFGFAAPGVGNQRTYSVIEVDNSPYSISLTSQQTVTSVNPDGTFTISIVDPTGNSVTVNETTYAITPSV